MVAPEDAGRAIIARAFAAPTHRLTAAGAAIAPRVDDVAAAELARNGTVFREANERIRETAERYGVTDLVPFICECADPTCTAVIPLSLAEYHEIRTDRELFLNASGHAAAAAGSGDVEQRRDRYDMVRKPGYASEVDPGRRPADGPA